MTDCDICAVVQRDGWNSTPWHHCHRCHGRWKGFGRAHCNVCHETFSTSGAADQHWGKTGHVPPSEVSKLRYEPDRGCWVYAGSYDHRGGKRGSDANGPEVPGQPNGLSIERQVSPTEPTPLRRGSGDHVAPG